VVKDRPTGARRRHVVKDRPTGARRRHVVKEVYHGFVTFVRPFSVSLSMQSTGRIYGPIHTLNGYVFTRPFRGFGAFIFTLAADLHREELYIRLLASNYPRRSGYSSRVGIFNGSYH